MKYSEVVISEGTLRDACSLSCDRDGTSPIVFLRKKNGKRLEGIVREIFPEELRLLLFTKKKGKNGQYETVKYEDILRWAILSKVEIAEEYQRLAYAIEYIGGSID